MTRLLDVSRRLNLIAWHHLGRGVSLGVHQQLDPDVRPVGPRGLVLFGVLLVIALTAEGPAQIGLAVLILSPMWLYAFAKVQDEVMENRSYIAVFGLALLAGSLAEHAPAGVAMLIILYGLRTYGRNRATATRMRYWEMAARESPRKMRPLVNIAERLGSTGQIDEAIRLYEEIWPKLDDTLIGSAGANLAAFLMKRASDQKARGETEAAERSIAQAVLVLDEAIGRAPKHPMLRNTYGVFLMTQRRIQEAMDELDAAIRLNPELANAYRNRGSCRRALGDWDGAQLDYRQAERIDGRRTGFEATRSAVSRFREMETRQ